jgi:single-stranded-DNA-specific exonuclease
MLASLHPGRTLPGATAVAERLEAAIRDGRRNAIYGDYDADGITATAVLWRTIRALRPDADLRWYVPDRFEEGYGLNEGALEQLAADGVRVVVTVDCGVSAVGPARRARELGLELLVTDHHHADPDGIADAVAIAHPSLPGRDPAPFADLCGAAVAWKVACELARCWCGGDRIAKVLNDALVACLPLVACGTVADVMPLLDENRIFVACGLGSIQSTRIAGLRALLDDSQLDRGKKVESSDVGFRIGPRLNVTGRLGHAAEAVELLITEDPVRARAIVRTVSEMNERRKRMDREFFEQACLRIEHEGLAEAGAIVLADARWHEGVVGIVAQKVAERYGRPAILMAIREDGTAKGSGRSVGGIDILAAVRGAAGPLMQRGGGHAFALGVTVAAGDVPEFARLVAAECAARSGGRPAGPVRHYDLEIDPQELTSDAVAALDRLRPYGRGNPEPAFLLRGVRPVGGARVFGGQGTHLEFTLPGAVRVVWWGGAEHAARLAPGRTVDVIVRPELDTFRGNRGVQAILADLRPTQA